MTEVVAVDLGGTNIRAARVDARGTILAREKIPTRAEEGFGRIVPRIAEMISQVRGPNVAGIGFATPGTPDPETGAMNSRAVNIADSAGYPLCPRLTELTGLPAAADNDGNLAAYAEWWRGAARGQRVVLMFTLGTGIGGGLVVDGRIYHGAANICEFGHISIDLEGRDCVSGVQGAWEAYASAAAAGKDAAAALKEGGEAARASRLWALCGGNPDAVEARHLCDAAREGDAFAGKVLDRFAEYFAAGLGTFMTALNPSCVVLGGGMALAGEVLFSRVRAALLRNRAYRPCVDGCKLVAAELGDDAGLIGAARLAFARAGVEVS
ncbi:MAG: ROK family protein [Planctomycetota bacterium]|nr:ROK family protein [Planctomycetota bacterium]